MFYQLYLITDRIVRMTVVCIVMTLTMTGKKLFSTREPESRILETLNPGLTQNLGFEFYSTVIKLSDDYITETESEEESSVRETGHVRDNGVQFVRPKIWESGGGEWKQVTDRY